VRIVPLKRLIVEAAALAGEMSRAQTPLSIKPVNVRCRLWQKANRAKVNAYKARYRKENLEKHSIAQKRYRQAHRKKFAALQVSSTRRNVRLP